jgi:phosphoglycolate phosphatase-like HAD superfamily hydrolase
VLVDLDGTVLRDRAGRRAMLEAVEATAGRRPADPDRHTFTGRTDAWIARELLRRVGHSAGDDAVKDVHARYLERLAVHIAEAGCCTALPGASRLGLALREAAEAGRAAPHLLLTGNLREGARRKLAAAALLEAFPPVGAFGDEHEDRAHVAALAASLAPACRPVVLGDAPADVAAARAIGARAVLVTTGPTPVDELRAAGPDALLSSLDDTDAALDALLG